MTLIERMRRQGLPTNVRALFANPTPAGLAAVIGSGGEVAVPPNLIPPGCAAITPEMLPLAELSQADIDRIVGTVPGGASNVQDIYPLAPSQEGILFHHLLAAKGDPYLLQTLMAFDTRERFEDFLGALQAAVARHDILRTAVAWEGLPEPRQVVWREASLIVEEVALDSAAGDVGEQLRARFDPCQYRLDVRRAPLMHGFIACDKGRWLLLLLAHHLALDHTTLAILVEEAQAHLLGRAERLTPPLPFRNFVAQARLGVSQAEHEAYFRAMLGDVTEPTAPFGLLDAQGDGSGIQEARLDLDAALARRLRARARSLGVSAASLFHQAFAQVLARVSGRADVVFGTVLFGRMHGGEGADRALGMFINTLPVRVRLGEESVTDSVRRMHEALTKLLRHEHASLALVQRCSAVQTPTPLFSALLNYRHSPVGAEAPGEASPAWDGVEMLHAEERNNYPFTLSVDDLGDGFQLTAQTQRPVAPDRVCAFMRVALERLADALETAPETAARTIDVLPDAERRKLLEEWNATAHAYAEPRDIIGRFEAQVLRSPEAVAASCGGLTLGYHALNERANRFAHALIKEGAGPDCVVALLDERGLDFLAMMLAIFKAGAAYLPLDPAHPDGRIAQVLAELQVGLLFAGAACRDRAEAIVAAMSEPKLRLLDLAALEAREDRRHNPHRRHGPQNLAFVIYTSGSTGKPKGAMVEHQGMFNNLITKVPALELTALDVIAQTASQCFDISVWQFLTALTLGARVEIFPDAISHDPPRLLDEIAACGVTVLEAVPSMIRALLDASEAGAALAGLRWLLPCGEAFAPELCRRFMDRHPQVRLLNAYGPAECSDDVSYYPILTPPDGNDLSVPIGRPVDNTRLYLLNRWLEPAPAGVPGEILRRRCAGWPRLSQPSRPHRGGVPARSLRAARGKVLPHRRSRPLPRRWSDRISRAGRSSGEDPRLPDRAGRGRGGALPDPWGARSGGLGARG